MSSDPHVTEVTSQVYIGRRFKLVPVSDLNTLFDKNMGEICQTAGEKGFRIVGAPAAQFNNMSGDHTDVEMGVPVADVSSVQLPDGFVTFHRLAGKVVEHVHVGPHSGMPAAHGKVEEFIRQQKLKPAGAVWEEYLDSPDHTPADQVRTRLICPVAESDEPHIKTFPERNYVGQRFMNVPLKQIAATWDQHLGGIFAQVARKGLHPVGAPIGIYYRSDDTTCDMEIAVPVDRQALNLDDGFTAFTRPETRTAAYLHLGSYAGMEQAHMKVVGFVRAKGLQENGPPFEEYLNTADKVPEAELQTWVAYPVA